MPNDYSDSILTIDLKAIADNYAILQDESDGAEVASVVKANAYGLGVAEVAPVLQKAGCKKFFVANIDEALELRSLLPDAFISVFHGIGEGQGGLFSDNDITPVLNSIHQIKIWSQHADKISKRLPAILHVDSGMNRLGVSEKDAKTISADNLLSGFDIKYIMSHLACADVPSDKKNKEQLEYVTNIRKLFPNVPFSFANSYGVFLGEEFRFDMVRPGVALYGVNPTPRQNNLMHPVVSLTGKILQIREIDTDSTVGYGASCKLRVGSVLATVPVGYADGYSRALGNKGFCAIDGEKVPIVGRVSMDLTILDVTNIRKDNLHAGKEVELIGNNIKVDDVAESAGTIGYEVLTNLGRRYKREYR